MENTLYYGDNLDILRDLVKQYGKQPFIHLIYIDPPFNSKRNYNMLFEDLIQSQENGEKIKAQKEAFIDTWSNVEITDQLEELKGLDNLKLYQFLDSNRALFTDSQMSYLTMMAIRLYYMHKLLKETGSFYLHCDPTMSHYLKILLDIIFGHRNFRNEITWQRALEHNLASTRFDNVTDIIFLYTKNGDKATFYNQYMSRNQEELEKLFPYTEKETGRRFNHEKLEKKSNSSAIGYRIIQDQKIISNIGWIWSQETFNKRLQENPYLIYWTKNNRPRYKNYLDEYKGKLVSNLWTDFQAISSNNTEYLGYPTQKPEALLERIIKASSNEGDIVADFFAGCGTTVTVAEKLNRKWLGVDINHLAIGLVEEKRLKPLQAQYQVYGFPNDLSSAEKLAKEKPFEFEKWVVEYIFKGHSTKSTGDGGFDGHIAFDIQKRKYLCLLEVKGGGVTIAQTRGFAKTVDSKNADMGILICFQKQITSGMRKEFNEEGNIPITDLLYPIPKMSLISIEDILNKNYPHWLTHILSNITY